MPVARACSYRIALCFIPYFRRIAVMAPYLPRALMKSRSIASPSGCKQATQNAWPFCGWLDCLEHGRSRSLGQVPSGR